MYLLHDCSKQVTKETTFAEKLVGKIFFLLTLGTKTGAG